MSRTFEQFVELVKDSCDGQADRKGYTDGGVDGPNQLSQVGELVGFEPQHGIGEICYKCKEYLRNPREVLLIKIAGWAYILWKRHAGESLDALIDKITPENLNLG